MHVLLVDAPGACDSIAKLLFPHGITADRASNFTNARYFLEHNTPQLVITELDLPGQTGFELVAALRSQDEMLPILVFTSVELRSSYNFALWLGADGYALKSRAASELLPAVQSTAKAASFKAPRQFGDNDELRFYCRCGVKLMARALAGGKRVGCPRCQQLTLAPDVSRIAEGVWTLASDDADRDPNRPYFACEQCNSAIDVFSGDKRSSAKCRKCKFENRLPFWVSARRKHFKQFLHLDEEVDPHAKSQRSTQIQIRCRECETLYYIDPEHLTRTHCPLCHREEDSKSLKDSPLSIARLKSTGRYVRIKTALTERLRGKSFLVPEEKPIVIGSGPGATIRLTEENVAERHCAIHTAPEGLLVTVYPGATAVQVGDSWVQESAPVLSTLDLAVGQTVFTLHAINRSGQEQRRRRVAPVTVATQQFYGHAAIAARAARILQAHWESES